MLIEGWFGVEDQQVYGCFSISYGFFGGYANLGTSTALLCSGEAFGVAVFSIFSPMFSFLLYKWLMILVKLQNFEGLALFICMQVPGLSPWTQVSTEEFGHLSMDRTSENREKRRREDDESSDMPVISGLVLLLLLIYCFL